MLSIDGVARTLPFMMTDSARNGMGPYAEASTEAGDQ